MGPNVDFRKVSQVSKSCGCFKLVLRLRCVRKAGDREGLLEELAPGASAGSPDVAREKNRVGTGDGKHATIEGTSGAGPTQG